jgi:hypothetical protein
MEEERLATFIDSIIERLNKVKSDLKKEVDGRYFTLYCIGDDLEVYGLRIEREEERRLKRKED